jgi:hypothetical protein
MADVDRINIVVDRLHSELRDTAGIGPRDQGSLNQYNRMYLKDCVVQCLSYSHIVERFLPHIQGHELDI